MKFLLAALALGLLRVQSAIDRVTGSPLPLGLGVDAPEAAAAAAPTAAAPAVVETPAAAPAGLVAMFKGLLSVGGDKVRLGTDLAQVRTDLATRTTERDTARTDLTAAQTALATLCAGLGLKPSDLAGKDAAAITALQNERISAAAVEALASAGIPQASLPKPAPSTEAKTGAQLLAEYNTITNSVARGEFYAKHRDAMFGSN